MSNESPLGRANPVNWNGWDPQNDEIEDSDESGVRSDDRRSGSSGSVGDAKRKRAEIVRSPGAPKLPLVQTPRSTVKEVGDTTPTTLLLQQAESSEKVRKVVGEEVEKRARKGKSSVK